MIWYSGHGKVVADHFGFKNSWSDVIPFLFFKYVLEQYNTIGYCIRKQINAAAFSQWLRRWLCIHCPACCAKFIRDNILERLVSATFSINLISSKRHESETETKKIKICFEYLQLFSIQETRESNDMNFCF